ncbi:MAG TPA: Smr/MutS family protein [Stellaceae bacterium]|nr:Smr/MutS family protein [Stellaceae bacterium]
MVSRRPSETERALWRAETSDVLPLDGKAAPPRQEGAPPPQAPVPARRRASAAAPGGIGLDRRSALRLKRGQMAIAARLDLHGMTQAEAHAALLRFIAGAHDKGARVVLIITGKGSGASDGVLRRAVPLWLAAADCRARVLATAPAQPKDGGAGALYVLLRRHRALT